MLSIWCVLAPSLARENGTLSRVPGYLRSGGCWGEPIPQQGTQESFLFPRYKVAGRHLTGFDNSLTLLIDRFTFPAEGSRKILLVINEHS